jgi:hypothetical protein
MTGERESERELERFFERWLVDGVDEMPDRVYLTVLDRVERQSQHGAWRVSWRNTRVNGYLKPMLAAAAVLAVVVAGLAVIVGPTALVGGPAPTTAPTSPTPPPPELPDGKLEVRDYILRAVTGDPMAFTITPPAGWTGFGGFFLGGPQSSSGPRGIGISVNHDPQVVSDPCDSSIHSPDPSSSPLSVDALVEAIVARADLDVSGVTDTELAGYRGKRLDVQFPADLGCSNHYLFAEPKGLYANGSANRWRVWVLDVYGETGVVVLLDYAGTPAADRAAAQAAIDSIRITP